MAIRIFVEIVAERKITLFVKQNEKILVVKRRVMEQEGIPPIQQSMMLNIKPPRAALMASLVRHASTISDASRVGQMTALSLGNRRNNRLKRRSNRYLDDASSISDYDIGQDSTIYLQKRGLSRIGRPWGSLCMEVIIQINSADFRYKYIGNVFTSYFKTFDCVKELRIEIARYLKQDEQIFCETYDLYHDHHSLSNSYRGLWDSRHNGIHLELKTKKDNLWYIQHQNKIKKPRFNLLVFGFTRKMEAQHGLNVPIYLTQICEKYTWIARDVSLF